MIGVRLRTPHCGNQLLSLPLHITNTAEYNIRELNQEAPRVGRLSIRASPLVGTRRELARWDGVASIASDQKKETAFQCRLGVFLPNPIVEVRN